MKHKSISIISIIVCLCSMNALAQEDGEIIFSKKLINPSDPAELVTEFQSSDYIYSVAFFGKSILEIIGKESAKEVPVEVLIYELKAPLYDYQQPSEMQLETSTLWISGDALQKSYLPIDIIPAINETGVST